MAICQYQIQCGSEFWTCPDFECWKQVPFSNGAVFKWDLTSRLKVLILNGKKA